MIYLRSIIFVIILTSSHSYAKNLASTLRVDLPVATSITGWSYQVTSLVENRDWDGLLGLTRLWTEDDPENPLAWSLLGIANYALKQPVQAIDAYRKALHLKPDDAESWNNMGNAYDQLDQLEMGIQSYQEAIRIKPNFVEAWYNLGLNYQLRGEREKAQEVYLVLDKLDPKTAEKLFVHIDKRSN